MILNRAAQRQRAKDQRKDFLKDELLRMGCYKRSDGKQLYELSLSELENLHIEVKARFGKEMSKED